MPTVDGGGRQIDKVGHSHLELAARHVSVEVKLHADVGVERHHERGQRTEQDRSVRAEGAEVERSERFLLRRGIAVEANAAIGKAARHHQHDIEDGTDHHHVPHAGIAKPIPEDEQLARDVRFAGQDHCEEEVFSVTNRIETLIGVDRPASTEYHLLDWYA
eukprot:2992551-Prymnesium_polylepis.1